MYNEKFYQNIIKKYDAKKLDRKSGELFEIVKKYEFYKKRTEKWYMKPVYEAARIISLFIAEAESKNALKKH